MANSTALAEAKEQIVGYKGKLATMRETAERGIDTVVSGVAAAVTGAALGTLMAKNKDKPGEMPEVSDVPAGVIAGGLAYLGAMTTKKRRYQHVFESIGASAVGVSTALYFKEKVPEWEKEDKAAGRGPANKVRKFREGMEKAIDGYHGVRQTEAGPVSEVAITRYG